MQLGSFCMMARAFRSGGGGANNVKKRKRKEGHTKSGLTHQQHARAFSLACESLCLIEMCFFFNFIKWLIE